MRKFGDLKISTKLIIVAVFISIMATIVNGYFIYSMAHKKIDEQILGDLSFIVQTKKENLVDYFNAIRSRSADFSSDGHIRKSVKDIIEGKNSEIAKELNNYLELNKRILDRGIYGITIIDMNGKVIASTSDGELGLDESQDDYFLKAKELNFGESYLTDVSIANHFGREAPRIITAAPVFDIDKKDKIGVLVNYFDTEELKNIFKVTRHPDIGIIPYLAGQEETMEIYLINKDKLVVTESKFGPEQVLKRMVDTETVRRCLEKGEGMIGKYIDYRGKLTLASSLCIDAGKKWTLVAKIDDEEVHKSLKDIKIFILLLSSFIILGASLLVYFLTKSFVNPIEKLAAVCRKMAAGDLQQRADIESKDELGGLAKAFNEMAEKLEETDRSKSEFVSLASHQLLTPLTTVSWYIETLLAGSVDGLSEKQKEYVKNIYNTNHNMIETVRALLDVSRIEMGTFYIKPQPVNIADVINSVLDELAPRIKEKGLEIVSDLDPNMPIVDMDPQLIRIVFQNLLSNAVKYSLGNKNVTIGAKKRKQGILITVSDNGYGIPKELQKNVFSKFFRAHNIKEKVPEGTGLGLYIVKSIVDNSGGKIWFESEENKGTTFYISYPLSGMKAKEGTKQLGA